MTPFTYMRASSIEDAVKFSTREGHRLLGGGTNLVDLMRKGVEHPTALVDVTALSSEIQETDQGGLLIGAAVRNSTVAAHPLVRTRFPVLSRAILAGASAQIRNMATVAGNLMQRTRCLYFNDAAGSRCNKRELGSGCDALEGFNRYHAIIGASGSCVATHPSDMCVALAALGAQVHLAGGKDARTVPLVDFHLLPGERPDLETVLEAGEIIIAVEIPASPIAGRSTYRKVRDRASYAFALVSVAAAITTRDGAVDDIRLAFGGIAPKPWRAFLAEKALRGGPATPEAIAAAMDTELASARPLAGNAFKVELAKRTAGAVLTELTGEGR
ncbi:FAD binding domain-containing protein [Nitratireductor sp. GCM10026969]|uniref:FAD binding domain-containing protein n=1 Tax=Nitratireductor sp. GCM10026969 TaxID=3252645 RepID=UPI003606A460